MSGPILITGGAGFVGSRLAARLRQLDRPVTVVDSFDGAYDPDQKWQNIAPLVRAGGIELVVGDVRDPTILDQALSKQDLPVAAIAHLAGQSSGATAAPDDLIRFLETNAVGTATVLAAAARHHVDRVVLASGSDVYDSLSSGVGACTEDVALTPVDSCGVSLAAMELAARAHATRVDRCSVLVLRLFGVYGVGQPPQSWLARAAAAAASGDRSALAAALVGRASAVHVDDAVGAFERALAAEATAAYRVFNIAHPEIHTPVTLSAAIALAVGAAATTLDATTRDTGPGARADVSRARDELGFEATIDFAAGVAETGL